MSQDTSTGNPSGSGGSSRRSEAEAAFSEYLARREHGEAPDFETFCADRPALADELRHLHEQWLRFQSFNQRLKERFGKDADPGVSLDPREESPSGPSSALLSQLAAHSPDASRYKLEGEIARGGMGAIVKVWDGDLRRHLAMKVVLGRTGAADKGATPAVDERTLGRFLEEAQVTGQLDHPGVVPVHELGLDDQGRVYFTMRLVKGRDLKTILGLVREGQEDWNPTRALGVLLKACEALAYAHSKGVVHRDLKPANVMVGRFGEVYVMDWGLARVMGRPDRKDIRLKVPATTSLASLETLRKDAAHETPDSPLITMDGDVVGTPAYMPPEQARGEVEAIGPRADVYSMGAILYELLAGRMPYVPPGARLSARTILAAVIAGPPQPVHALQPGVPVELEAICEKAMAREPAARYADVLELAEDLRAYIEGRVVRAHRTGAVVELRKWIVRNKPLAASLAAAVLLLVGGLAASLAFKQRSDRNAALAESNATQARQATALAEQRRIEAEKKTNDMLRLSAIQELKELVERADALWPAVPKMVPKYEQWLEEAKVLVDGSPTHPGLKDHEALLAEIRQRAQPITPEQAEQDRRSSPRFAEWDQAQAKLTWMRRMLGQEPWPTEAEVEAALLKETLPADGNGLNRLAWSLVDPDPEKLVYGSEVKALILARRAIGAEADVERALIRDTLAWALCRCGRLEEGLAEEQHAVDEAQGALKQQLAASLQSMHEAAALWSPGEPHTKQAEQADTLSAHVADLEREMSERRTYEFHDAQDRWWHRELSNLVADLKAFADSETGLESEGISEQHGWGIGRRAEFARTIEARSVSGAEAQRRWAEAIDAIGKSPKYGGLALTPQLGLLPIGPDRDSGLWEFWHLQSGDEPVPAADGKLTATESTGLVLVLIPGGTFGMGAQKTDPAGRNYDPQAQPDEWPVHEVTLSPYFLSKYEMTQGQWERFTGMNPSYYTTFGGNETSPRQIHPVEQVSWNDATDVLSRLGLELPSEAQWERAARAGTDSPWSTGRDRETLSGSVNLADQALARAGADWLAIKDWPELDDGWDTHAVVGSFRPNPFGLHDVHGNVLEWCRDRYENDFYGRSSLADPVNDAPGANFHVGRGGSFNQAASLARSARRGFDTHVFRANFLGLRPAKGIAP